MTSLEELFPSFKDFKKAAEYARPDFKSLIIKAASSTNSDLGNSLITFSKDLMAKVSCCKFSE
jgi:hypothetical protein